MNGETQTHPVAVIQQADHRSTHFVVRSLAGPLEEEEARVLTARLEAVREELLKALVLDDPAGEPLAVYLLAAGTALPRGGTGERVSPSGTGVERQISVMYGPETLNEGLERELVALLLRETLDTRDRVAPLLVDGLVGYVAQRCGKREPVEPAALLAVAQTVQGGGILAPLLSGPGDGTMSYYQQAATSFVTFLLTTYGVERLKRFVQTFDFAGDDTATEAIFQKPIALLEKEWLTSLRGARQSPAGVMNFLRSLVGYWRPYWPVGLLMFFMIVLASAYDIATPLSFRFLIDNAVIGGNKSVLVFILVGLTVGAVVRTVAKVVRDRITASVGARIMNHIRRQMFEHLQHLSMDFYARAQVGNIVAHFSTDLAALEKGLTRACAQVMYRILNLVFSLVLLFVVEWHLALVTLVVSPLAMLGPRILGPRAARANYQRKGDEARLVSTVQENAGAQQVIKTFGLQKRILAGFGEQLSQLGASSKRSIFLNLAVETSSDSGITFIQLVVVMAGTILAFRHALTPGGLVSFLGLLVAMSLAATSLIQILPDLLEATGGKQRIDELFAELPRVSDLPDARPLPRMAREVRFENVTFSYTGEQINLKEVSLHIPAGASAAFVGPSGSGKSTVLNLMMRFYDPNSGAVTIDGNDLRQGTLASLSSQLGAVFQDTALFNLSIRENIRLGRLDATDMEIEEAARAAEVHDLIMTFPQGYDTTVGERGGRLSGGQRQRVAIARAILRDPAILILDEATSALDVGTEAAINVTLKRLGQGRTVVSVTHRLGAMPDMDQIFVLDKGQIVEHGSHQELLAIEGLYAQLWQKQSGFAISDDGQRARVTAERLQAIPLFARLDQALLDILAHRFVSQNYAEGQTIIAAGDRGDTFYLIVRGQVEVLTSGPGGQQRQVTTMGDGDYFGETAVLEGTMHTTTVRTVTPTLCLALAGEQFLSLLEEAPELRTALEEEIGLRRLRWTGYRRGRAQSLLKALEEA